MADHFDLDSANRGKHWWNKHRGEQPDLSGVLFLGSHPEFGRAFGPSDWGKIFIRKGVEIEVEDEVKAWLIKEGYEPLYGARPMRRTIQRAIGDPLSEEMIKGRFKESRKIRVVLRDGAPTFIEQEAMAGV